MRRSTDKEVIKSTQLEEIQVDEEVVLTPRDIVIPMESLISTYRLNFRTPSGTIRAEIPKSLIFNLSVEWPDLLRVIPSEHWVTLEEIAVLVSTWENASPRKSITRTVEQIEAGLAQLIETGVLLKEDK